MEEQIEKPSDDNGREDIFSPKLRSLIDQTDTILESQGRDLKFAVEKQTKSQAPAYRLLDEANRASKRGIACVRDWDWDGFKRCVQENKEAFFDLSQVDLPADVLWQFTSDGGQELAEFLQLAYLYPFLVNDEKAIQYSLEDLAGFQKNYGFTPQQWLAGLCDALGELYKTMDPYEYNSLDGGYAERLEKKIILNERLLAIQEMVFYSQLDPVRSFPPRINSNSRRRGPGQTLSSKVHRVQRNMEQTKKAISQLKDQLSLFREQTAQINELKGMLQKFLSSAATLR